jgi:hypothetical protein
VRGEAEQIKRPAQQTGISLDGNHLESKRLACIREVSRLRSPYLALCRLAIESYEREEYLLFSGFDDEGASLDQETMEKLFGCSGQVADIRKKSCRLAFIGQGICPPGCHSLIYYSASRSTCAGEVWRMVKHPIAVC